MVTIPLVQPWPSGLLAPVVELRIESLCVIAVCPGSILLLLVATGALHPS